MQFGWYILINGNIALIIAVIISITSDENPESLE